MPKEKNYNPVQAQRKADKAREIKKGKAEAQSRRNEKLARKNPERIQKQIDDLKAVVAKGGKLTRHEEQVLEGLEKELQLVRKARDALGDKAPSFGRGTWDGSRSGGALGKRRRGGDDDSSSDEDVPEDVKRIPMPRDTPPPIPKAEMDKWYAKRRAKREAENAARRRETSGDEARDGQENGKDTKGERGQKNAPPVEPKTVYEAKPVVRDLRKEAVSAFVPTSVQLKMSKGKGQGGLMEPEEADRLEREGYLKTASAGGRNGDGAGGAQEDEDAQMASRHVMMEEVEDEEA
ncbi:hypothetical protein BBK36DRAFT_1133932 [Trichoderma citrinoviride]|uniref:Wbp11/ELF5/Saf1 N-terminal domain-containing protein n=1 Tax=Trichoderma citrinoviride TaxID=58853 RepID=A0A2T4BM05_9HYPO|nr:hypothetical protein BBK36DRAFT_1133932 [Trichoderma citrinoviride]PTB70343.1 hypothetical protein BBK36DRAFT_1133932 [Trichoderma citrinoviride]